MKHRFVGIPLQILKMKIGLLSTSSILIIVVHFFTIPPLSAFSNGMKEAHEINYKKIATHIQPLIPDIQQHVMLHFKNLLTHSTLREIIKEPTDITFNTFPIETPLMSPGKFSSRKVHIPLPHPIFIIGSDSNTKDWLKQHIEQLKQLQAVGFLVQAQNQHDLEAMKLIVDGLTLVPLSGNAIAERFNLPHYPVLLLQDTHEDQSTFRSIIATTH